MPTTASWLIPIWKARADWLSQCLDSCALASGNIEHEIVACLDGPVEDRAVREVLRQWAEADNFHLSNFRVNRGVEYALNECIARAKGDYFARIDADDWSEPFRLQKQIEFLDKYALDACGSWMRVVPEKGIGGTMKWQEFYREGEAYGLLMDRKTPCAHPATLFRASSIRSLGADAYPLGYRRAEDLALHCRAFQRGWKIGNVQEPLVNYRTHDGSTCVEWGPEQYESSKKAIREWHKLK